jgi:pimeloyl-ACP methyl ester carboxylesterase
LLTTLHKFSLKKKKNKEMKTEQIKVKVPWGHVAVQLFTNSKSGTKSEPIIAMHGSLDNSNSFKPLAPLLTSTGEYHLISIDLPGHGFSSPIPMGMHYSPKILLSALRRLVKYFELNEFIFLTHSYSGTLATMYSTIFPDEAKAIIAIDWVTGSGSSAKDYVNFYFIFIYLNLNKKKTTRSNSNKYRQI